MAKSLDYYKRLAEQDPSLRVEEEGGVFIGIPAGSETEKRLIARSRVYRNARRMGIRVPFGGQPYRQPYEKGGELELLKGFTPNDLFLLQQSLVLAGLLDSYIPGQLDSSTRKAWLELLGMANVAGQNWRTTLKQIIDVGGVVDQSQREPFVARLTSEEDLRAIANAAALALYGGRLSEDAVSRFVAAFRQQQYDAQLASYQAQITGGVVDAGPTAEHAAAQAEALVRQENPEQVFTSQFGQMMREIVPGLARTAGGLLDAR